MKGAVIDLAKNLNTNWCQSWNVSFSGACMSPRSTSAFHSCHTQALGFKRIKAIQNNSVAVIFVMIDMWLDLTHHITTPWSSFPVGSNLFYCPSDCLRSHWCLYTHSQTPSYQLYISAGFAHLHMHTICTYTHKEHCLLSLTDLARSPQTFRRQLHWRQLWVLWQPESITVQAKSRPGAALKARPLTNNAPLVSIQTVLHDHAYSTCILHTPHTHTLQGKLTDSCPLSGHMVVRLIDTLSNQFACEKVKNDSYHWIIFAVSRCTQLLYTIRIPY